MTSPRDADGDRWVDQERQLQPLRAAGSVTRSKRRLDAGPKVERADLQLEAPGVDLREVEDVVDDPEQRLAAGADDLGELALARPQVGVEQQTAHADHRVHRRADLVAHRCQERPLGGVGLLCQSGLLFELGEQVGIRDGDRRLLGERLHDPAVPWFERPDLAPVDIDLAVVNVVDEHPDRHHAPDGRGNVGSEDSDVIDEDGFPVVDACSHRGPGSDLGLVPLVAGADQDEFVTLPAHHAGHLGVAQVRCLGHDALEDGVEVARVVADELQDVRCRRLELQ